MKALPIFLGCIEEKDIQCENCGQHKCERSQTKHVKIKKDTYM